MKKVLVLLILEESTSEIECPNERNRDRCIK